MDWSVVRKSERRRVVQDLPEVRAFPQNTICPSGNSSFFTEIVLVQTQLVNKGIWAGIRSIVIISPNVKLVRGRKRDASFRIERKRQASHHLEVELVVLV